MGNIQEDITQDKNSQNDSAKADDIIIELLEKHDFFCDQYNDVFMAADRNGAEIVDVESGNRQSSKFKQWLVGWYMKNHDGFILKSSVVEEVAYKAAALARYQDKQPKHLHMRVHRKDDLRGNPTEIYYDLLGGKAVHITNGDWVVTGNMPPVFRRHSHELPQVEPVKSSDRLDDLKKIINIKNDDDWLVTAVYTVTAFIPNQPRPVLLLTGPNGSCKTTAAKIIHRLVDPSVVEAMPLMKDTQEFMRTASRHYLLSYDNASHLSPEVSDNICRAVSGSSSVRRTLYSEEDTIYNVQLPIILNGIDNNLAYREDLLERCLHISLHRVKESERMSESQLYAEFNAMKAGVLGNIFTIIAKAMELYPNIQLKELPRMSDFARMGYAVAEAAGYGGDRFINAYKRVLDKQTELALNSNPVAQAAVFLTSKTGHWEGTASMFLLLNFNGDYEMTEDERNTAQYLRDHTFWPRNASVLGQRLNRAESTLKTLGIEMVHSTDKRPIYKNGQRWLELTDTKWEERLLEKSSRLDNLTEEQQTAICGF